MRKIIPFLVVSILVLSGLGAVALSEGETENFDSERISFSKPIVVENENYVAIELAESSADSWVNGKPMMPVVNKVYTFPFGTIINDVYVTFTSPKQMEITKPIKPSPEPQMLSMGYKTEASEGIVSYSEIDIYPEETFSYRTGAGLYGEERAIYLIVNINPVQYKPNENKILYYESAEIDVDYTLPVTPLTFTDQYDLLIITPSQFSSALQPLVDHKNSIGIETKLTTLDEIPSGVGVDEQEDIKYYIKDAIDNWDITYLLLVGAGLEGEELFPVRYASIPSSPYEDSFPSDLYYADIYDGSMSFSNWDYDGDGKYAEYPADIPNVDVIPDVRLGKLPANNAQEVRIVVDKIINYKAHNAMTNEIVQIGGDTFPGDPEGIYEGEFANEEVFSRLSGYSTTQLWGSTETLTKLNIAKGFKSGPDFIDFSGHGSPSGWSTHPPDDEDTWIPKAYLSFIVPHGWRYYDFDLFFVRHPKKLPVVFYNACSNNKYTASDKCISWKTLMKNNGGGIAAFGASGIGYGAHGSDETERLMGWMEVNTFDQIHNNAELGLSWANCVTNYYTTFSGSLNDGDYKTMLEYSMFADPTVSIEDGDDPVVHMPDGIPILGNFPLLARILEKIFG